MSQRELLGFARGAVASRYRACRRWGSVLAVLGASVMAIPAVADPGEEALIVAGTVMVLVVVPGVALFLFGRRDVERHPLVVAVAQGHPPTFYDFTPTLTGHVCHAVVVVDGIPHRFAIPRRLMPR